MTNLTKMTDKDIKQRFLRNLSDELNPRAQALWDELTRRLDEAEAIIGRLPQSDFIDAGPKTRCFYCGTEIEPYKRGVPIQRHCTNPDCPAVRARDRKCGRILDGNRGDGMTDLKAMTNGELIVRYGSRRVGESNGDHQSVIEGDAMYAELIRRLTRLDEAEAMVRELLAKMDESEQYIEMPYPIPNIEKHRLQNTAYLKWKDSFDQTLASARALVPEVDA